jgi:hypothetical protein
MVLWFFNSAHMHGLVVFEPSFVTLFIYDTVGCDFINLDDMFIVAGKLYTWCLIVLLLVAILLLGTMVGAIAVLITL